jgi:hypothetical protein
MLISAVVGGGIFSNVREQYNASIAESLPPAIEAPVSNGPLPARGVTGIEAAPSMAE